MSRDTGGYNEIKTDFSSEEMKFTQLENNDASPCLGEKKKKKKANKQSPQINFLNLMESDCKSRHYFTVFFSLKPIKIIGAFNLMNMFQSNHHSEINDMSFLFR